MQSEHVEARSYTLACGGFLFTLFCAIAINAWWIKTKLKGLWISYKDHIPTGKISLWIYPRGVWLPLHENVRYGIFYSDFIQRFKYTQCYLSIGMVMLAFVTSFRPNDEDGCTAQILVVASLTMCYGLCLCFFTPHQSRATSILRGLVNILQSMILFSILSVEMDLAQLLVSLSMMLYLCVTFDSIIVVYMLYWEGAVRHRMVIGELAMDKKIETPFLEGKECNVQVDESRLFDFDANVKKTFSSRIMLEDVEMEDFGLSEKWVEEGDEGIPWMNQSPTPLSVESEEKRKKFNRLLPEAIVEQGSFKRIQKQLKGGNDFSLSITTHTELFKEMFKDIADSPKAEQTEVVQDNVVVVDDKIVPTASEEFQRASKELVPECQKHVSSDDFTAATISIPATPMALEQTPLLHNAVESSHFTPAPPIQSLVSPTILQQNKRASTIVINAAPTGSRISTQNLSVRRRPHFDDGSYDEVGDLLLSDKPLSEIVRRSTSRTDIL
eukprot:PhF_6_TR13434/c1_g1_i1/m.21441